MRVLAACGLVLLMFAASSTAAAHNISEANANFVFGLGGTAIAPFLYLGAKHMFTGVDHLLFLVGVVFFLDRFRDVVLYVSLFTVGHSLTLLAGVLGGWQVNAYLVDAVIGASVVYKAFENMGGFRALGRFRPNTRAAVFAFGLFHGLGLATKLQELALSREGLLTNLVSFNVGVEVGQIAALSLVLLVLVRWRFSAQFERHAFMANTLLMVGGCLLVGYQLTGYALST